MEQRKKRPDKLLYVPRAKRQAQPSVRQHQPSVNLPVVAAEGTDTGELSFQQVMDAGDLHGTLKQDNIIAGFVNDDLGRCADSPFVNQTPAECVEDLPPIRCMESGWSNAEDKYVEAGADKSTTKSCERAGDNQNIFAAHSPCDSCDTTVNEFEDKQTNLRQYSELLVDLSDDSVKLCQTGDRSYVEHIEPPNRFSSAICGTTSDSKCVLGNEGSAEINFISFDEVPDESEGGGSVSLQVNDNTAVVKEESEKEDEDQSWEAMFDDDGECLEPHLMEELMDGLSLDEVKLQHAYIDYLAFQPKEPTFTDSEFDHVIEIYDFSPDTKTEDIIQAFSPFRTKGFVVKWVDHSHVLGVFSSATAAREGLRLPQAMLQTCPISQASKQSQQRLQACYADFLEPVKPRPPTSAALASRLVARALGKRPDVNSEKHEREKQQLKQAREQRRLATQQKEAAWEGRPDAGV
uniref:coiled-coil domain-containing protein R3HCC1L-like n=1 Tax=Myxine glutinosa TaxID=7769 RepID=UPI00358E8BBC